MQKTVMILLIVALVATAPVMGIAAPQETTPVEDVCSHMVTAEEEHAAAEEGRSAYSLCIVPGSLR